KDVPLIETIDLVCAFAVGMDRLHSKGIWHGELAMRNIVLQKGIGLRGCDIDLSYSDKLSNGIQRDIVAVYDAVRAIVEQSAEDTPYSCCIQAFFSEWNRKRVEDTGLREFAAALSAIGDISVSDGGEENALRVVDIAKILARAGESAYGVGPMLDSMEMALSHAPVIADEASRDELVELLKVLAAHVSGLDEDNRQRLMIRLIAQSLYGHSFYSVMTVLESHANRVLVGVIAEFKEALEEYENDRFNNEIDDYPVTYECDLDAFIMDIVDTGIPEAVSAIDNFIVLGQMVDMDWESMNAVLYFLSMAGRKKKLFDYLAQEKNAAKYARVMKVLCEEGAETGAAFWSGLQDRYECDVFEPYLDPGVIEEAFAIITNEEQRSPGLIVHAKDIWARTRGDARIDRILMLAGLRNYEPEFFMEDPEDEEFYDFDGGEFMKDRADAVIVSELSCGMTAAHCRFPFIKTYNLCQCSALILFDRENRIILLAHFDGLTTVSSSLDRMISELVSGYNVDTRNLDARLIGSVEMDRDMARLIQQELGLYGVNNVFIDMRGQDRAIIADARTGAYFDIVEVREEDFQYFLSPERIYLSDEDFEALVPDAGTIPLRRVADPNGLAQKVFFDGGSKDQIEAELKSALEETARFPRLSVLALYLTVMTSVETKDILPVPSPIEQGIFDSMIDPHVLLADNAFLKEWRILDQISRNVAGMVMQTGDIKVATERLGMPENSLRTYLAVNVGWADFPVIRTYIRDNRAVFVQQDRRLYPILRDLKEKHGKSTYKKINKHLRALSIVISGGQFKRLITQIIIRHPDLEGLVGEKEPELDAQKICSTYRTAEGFEQAFKKIRKEYPHCVAPALYLRIKTDDACSVLREQLQQEGISFRFNAESALSDPAFVAEWKGLTETEQNIISLAFEGTACKQIAKETGYSLMTVYLYLGKKNLKKVPVIAAYLAKASTSAATRPLGRQRQFIDWETARRIISACNSFTALYEAVKPGSKRIDRLGLYLLLYRHHEFKELLLALPPPESDGVKFGIDLNSLLADSTFMTDLDRLTENEVLITGAVLDSGSYQEAARQLGFLSTSNLRIMIEQQIRKRSAYIADYLAANATYGAKPLSPEQQDAIEKIVLGFIDAGAVVTSATVEAGLIQKGMVLPSFSELDHQIRQILEEHRESVRMERSREPRINWQAVEACFLETGSFGKAFQLMDAEYPNMSRFGFYLEAHLKPELKIIAESLSVESKRFHFILDSDELLADERFVAAWNSMDGQRKNLVGACLESDSIKEATQKLGMRKNAVQSQLTDHIYPEYPVIKEYMKVRYSAAMKKYSAAVPFMKEFLLKKKDTAVRVNYKEIRIELAERGIKLTPRTVVKYTMRLLKEYSDLGYEIAGGKRGYLVVQGKERISIPHSERRKAEHNIIDIFDTAFEDARILLMSAHRLPGLAPALVDLRQRGLIDYGEDAITGFGSGSERISPRTQRVLKKQARDELIMRTIPRAGYDPELSRDQLAQEGLDMSIKRLRWLVNSLMKKNKIFGAAMQENWQVWQAGVKRVKAQSRQAWLAEQRAQKIELYLPALRANNYNPELTAETLQNAGQQVSARSIATFVGWYKKENAAFRKEMEPHEKEWQARKNGMVSQWKGTYNKKRRAARNAVTQAKQAA
ncbi:MAG: hypothetical protein WC547_07290, partial [Candidatus Omnitrophota bacterium]